MTIKQLFTALILMGWRKRSAIYQGLNNPIHWKHKVMIQPSLINSNRVNIYGDITYILNNTINVSPIVALQLCTNYEIKDRKG